MKFKVGDIVKPVNGINRIFYRLCDNTHGGYLFREVDILGHQVGLNRYGCSRELMEELYELADYGFNKDLEEILRD